MFSIYAHEIGEEGLEHEEELSSEDLAVIAENDVVYKPLGGWLKVKLSRVDDYIRVNGTIEAQVEATCVSCLDTFKVEQKLPLELFLSPGEDIDEASADEEEILVEDEKSGIDHYNPEEPIEIGRMAIELLCIALPMHPRCKEDCKGLCQECGANLNHETCNCRHIADPRWHALANIKLDNK